MVGCLGPRHTIFNSNTGNIDANSMAVVSNSFMRKIFISYEIMRVKNIIIVNDFSDISGGGASKVAFDVAIALARNGYHVTFFSGTGEENARLYKEGIKTISLHLPDMLHDKNKLRAAWRSIWNSNAYKAILELLDSYKPTNTIVMIHGFSKTLSSSVFSAVGRKGYKIIYILHDYFAACPNGGFYNYQKSENCELLPMSLKCWGCNCDVRNYPQKVYRCIRQLVVQHNLKNTPKICAYNVSELSGNLMKPYIGKWFSEYSTLYSPVDMNEGQYIDITSNNKYVFIGRLSEEKGIRNFCKVVSELSLQGVVLGEGYLMDEMKKKYSTIQFVGWADNKTKIQKLKEAKCLIFPSKVHETFGLTIAETLSYGIPCIMPTGCGASFLIQDGLNGFLYPMNDYNALKDRVRQFEKLPLQKLMISTRNSFDKNQFSVVAYIEKLEDIFNRM